jgi:hypothetical protein
MDRVWGQDHHLRPQHRRGIKTPIVYSEPLWCPVRKPPSQTKSPLPALGDLGNTFAQPLVCVFRLMPHRISSGRKSCFRWPWIAAFISCHFPLLPAWHGNVLEAAGGLEWEQLFLFSTFIGFICPFTKVNQAIGFSTPHSCLASSDSWGQKNYSLFPYLMEVGWLCRLFQELYLSGLSLKQGAKGLSFFIWTLPQRNKTGFLY